MTIEEALERNIKFVRKPYWNPTASLELKQNSQWCILHDLTQEAPLPIPLVRADDKRDDWEGFEKVGATNE